MVLLFLNISFGINIPNKHPITIPIISDQIGFSSTSVNFLSINPTNVPNVAPKRSDYVLP